ncbi:ABC transporter G family member 14 isoform X2 [Rhododendron vialii]|uniref:ABC transporter G family member 14 isoform X2 n=1 Tax=Rhododendron vialii TaxID=182163 RepID=UPI00265F8E19|nr:ABC transporter G family member 14 isoform X2 [Rhododendron vialii]
MATPSIASETHHEAVLANPVQAKSKSFLQLPLHQITLKFEDVVYKARLEPKGFCCGATSSSKEKTILNGLTGMVCPGELLAMLGPTGSGKTTLLTALGGRHTGKLSGKITYNGQPFSGSIRRRTGFVAQQDTLYPHLTVTETLLFTALLRLPNSMANDEKVEHVERVITELGLTRCRNSMIGGPLVRGISGGEKKRVSIGQELLINPSLLLLDEPTSGLDSTTAQQILTTIKQLANWGRTVITTIHQPSSRLYHMFDKLILLSEGCPIYYGPASTALEYFSSIGFSTSITINPADLLLDLANGIGADYNQSIEQGDKTEQERKRVRDDLISAYDKNISTRLKAELCSSDVNNTTYTQHASTRSNAKPEQWCTSWWHQFNVLLLRGLRERRHATFNKLRIIQVISVAFLGGLLWWQTPTSHIADRTGMIFFFSVFWGFYPLHNAVFTFPTDRAMLIKERSSGMYRLSSYFLARIVGDLPLELSLPTAFTFIFYWMGGLKPNPVTFILFLLVVLFNVLVSQGLGLAFGAILMDPRSATTLASVTTMVFLMAGGLLLGVQYNEDAYYECSNGTYCRVADFPAIKAVGLNHLWIDVSAMAVMLVGYRFVAYLALCKVR